MFSVCKDSPLQEDQRGSQLTEAELVWDVSIGLTDPVEELGRESREPELVQLAGRRYPPPVTVRTRAKRSVSAERWNKISFLNSLLPITSHFKLQTLQ